MANKYKRYLIDSNIEIPRKTLYRMNKKAKVLDQQHIPNDIDVLTLNINANIDENKSNSDNTEEQEIGEYIEQIRSNNINNKLNDGFLNVCYFI
jgi:hypothetical protein